jgi:GNAT superfamily N-acetyltransferase
MTPTLYFLRSSEEKIVQNMLKFTHDNDKMYADFFGHSDKDLGLYALVENKIAGAIWCRCLKKEQNAAGFINEKTPILHVVVLEEFQGKGIGTFMMEQFLQEAAVLYEQISLAFNGENKELKFYEKFAFSKALNAEQKNLANEGSVLVKKLEKKEIIRPTDGYDPRRWMD